MMAAPPSAPCPRSWEPLDAALERAAMDAAPDGILLVDRGGTILMANAAMEAISGYGAAELRGESV
ncbi:MAG: PAS domain-containing protein, partial [Burkholderiaceae bacterium]